VDDDDFIISQYKARKAVPVKELIEAILLAGIKLENSLKFISLVVLKLYRPTKKQLRVCQENWLLFTIN